MGEIYLLSLWYNALSSPITTAPGQVIVPVAHPVYNASQMGNGTDLEVRAGYMGPCVGNVDMALDETRICSSSTKALAAFIRAERKTITHGNLSTNITPDPLNLIMAAEEFTENRV